MCEVGIEEMVVIWDEEKGCEGKGVVILKRKDVEDRDNFFRFNVVYFGFLEEIGCL